MKRRKFINHLNAVGGITLAGLYPAELFGDTVSPQENENQNSIPAVDKVATEGYSQIKQYNGKPTLFVDGKPYFPMAYLSYYPVQSRYKAMRDAGIRFFSLSITLGDRFYGAYRNGKVKLGKKGIWDAPGVIDFAIFDKSIREILDVAPDAFIFPRIYCDSPSWWDSFHPSETNRTFDGLPQRQSFSSTVWREETSEILRKIVRHITGSEYADRIVGLHIAAGETEESVHHQWLGPSDYSLAAKESFRKWLSRKYQNKEELLKKLTGKFAVEAELPSPAEREKAGFGDFYDPEASTLVNDYHLFRCDEIAESLEYLCKAVKEESHNHLFTGVFYGYTLVDWRDHSALSRLKESPYIDFLSCTNGGGKRTKIGEHDMHFLSETDSIQKANKLFYYEADTRTCMSKWISTLRPDVDPYHEYDTEGWLGPEPVEKTLELLKAVFSRVICTGSVHWWFDLWGGWYDHDQILGLFSKMQKIGDESLHLPRGSVSQVCVIVDEKSLLQYATATRRGTWMGSQMNQIGKIGAPYDIFLSEDLEKIDLSKYKLMVFLNSILMTDDQRDLIRRVCNKDDRVIMWMYAPGLINRSISQEHVSSLLNMNAGFEEKKPALTVQVQLPQGEITYQGSAVSPFIFLKSGYDTALGTTSEGETVIGEKKEKGWTTVLASLPPVPWQVIQHYAVKAGVHIYCHNGEIVYANQSFLSVSSFRAGEKIITLPRKMILMELPDKGMITPRRINHKIEFSAESCRFFRVLDKA